MVLLTVVSPVRSLRAARSGCFVSVCGVTRSAGEEGASTMGPASRRRAGDGLGSCWRGTEGAEAGAGGGVRMQEAQRDPSHHSVKPALSLDTLHC